MTERSKRSYVPSYYSALVYEGLENKDRASNGSERAYQERSTVLAYLGLDPRLANLRDDPRFPGGQEFGYMRVGAALG